MIDESAHAGPTGRTVVGVSGEGHDRQIRKKTWTPRRLILAGGAAVVLAFVGIAIWSVAGGSKLKVDFERITVGTVILAPFQELVLVNGNVLPLATVFLDAVEGGRVEEVFVQEGAVIEKGEPILRLSNNTLELSLINADAQRIEQLVRLDDIRFRMKQRSLDLRQQMAEMDYRIRELELKHARVEPMFKKRVISEEEYDAVRLELDYWLNNKRLTLEGFRQDSLQMVSQLAQMESRIRRMDANYEVVQRILDDLTIRASVTGQLTALEAEIGDVRSGGFRFGQIDVTDGFKVRAGVDEFYIARVQRGQKATTKPIDGQTFPMRVTRVYPEVTTGRFEIDLEFSEDVPATIRRGQTIRFALEFSAPEEAVLVPRGGFYQSTGGQWVFVIGNTGDYAVRHPVRLGRQDGQHYEVLEGLSPGDRVVTSSYDTFGNVDRLIW